MTTLDDNTCGVVLFLSTRSLQPAHMTRIRQRGLSLIEMMVAMTISLFMLIALTLVYTSSKNSFGFTTNTARLSEDGSFALDMMGRDVRMAGFAGCAGSSFTTNSATPPVTTYTPKFDLIKTQTLSSTDKKPNPFSGVITGNLSDVFTAKNAVWGFDANNTGANGVLGGSASTYVVSTADPVLYLAGGSSQAMQISSAVTAGTQDVSIAVDTYKWANNTNSTFMIISDCKGSEIFRASSFSSGSGTIKNMAHATTDNDAASLANTYTSDAIVAPLVSSVYFLATPAGRSVSSLYRRSFNGSVATFEELVQNVDAITFQYGENTSNTTATPIVPTYIADIYRTDASSVADWSRVVSVRMGLIMVSDEDRQAALAPTTGQTLPWLGGSYALPNDRRVRRAYSTTVSIRNRMGL